MSKTSPFIELTGCPNNLHMPTNAHSRITRYIQTSAFLYISLNFNKNHDKIVVVKLAILFYSYLLFYTFYIFTIYMGDLCINIMYTFEAIKHKILLCV